MTTLILLTPHPGGLMTLTKTAIIRKKNDRVMMSAADTANLFGKCG
jgi:hypothetical protein